jgi:hypothetical protein
MSLSEWHQKAVENDELIIRLRQELETALAVREELFKVVIEAEPSAHGAAAGR